MKSLEGRVGTRSAGLCILILGISPCLPQQAGGGQPPSPWTARCPRAFFFATKTPGSGRPKYFAITPAVRASFEGDRVLFRSHDSAFQLQFLGSNPNVEMGAKDPQATRVNWLIGARPRAWSTDLPTYSKLVCHRIYPGIDVEFGLSEMRVKSEFVIAPGADPTRIGFRYTGLGRPHLDERGDLTFGSKKGELREESPTAFQWKQNSRVEVAARFSLSNDGVIRFKLGAFDAQLPLVIDPAVSYSSYVGGHGDSAATAIAADSNGNIYVTGWTDSVDFPMAGPIQGRGGGVDAFVLKLNPSGDTLLYATYIGGTGDDRGLAIAVDGTGNAYVAGTTTSADFPTWLPFQSRLVGTRDAFVLKLNAAGNGLTFSTYLGGSGSDSGNAIAVDTQGNAYIAGDTTSSDFPTLAPLQALNGGKQDAFVVKVNSTGTLVYSTYLGGSGDDHGAAIAVDPSGSAYVTGGTFSNNFPLANAFQAANGGGEDAFAAKLGPTGSSLMYSTYLGGSGGSAGAPEFGAGIAVDSQGNAFIVGTTSSTNFPALGALQVSYGGGTTDGFIAKLSPPGTALVYSTFVGGSSLDYANAIAVDLAGNAYVAGYTASADFPLAAPLQASLAGGYDAFVLRLNPSGSALNFATYYGGSGLDSANGIALDGVGNVYVAGQTLSSDFPIAGGIQASSLGTIEAFVMKLNIAVSAVPVTPSSGQGSSQTFTAVYSDLNGGSTITTADMIINSSLSSANACYVRYDQVHNQLLLANDAGTAFLPGIVPGSGAILQNSQCTVMGAGSSAMASGANLTVAVNITFKAGFAGAKVVYLYAADSANNNSGFQRRGTWTVTSTAAVLSVTKTHAGSLMQGQQNATYTVTVSDATGAPATSGTVTATETVPSGLTLVSMSGAGWTCGSTTCSRSDVLAGGSSYPPIAVTVNVAGNATSPQVNQVSVSGGGSAAANTSDSTVIIGSTLSTQTWVASTGSDGNACFHNSPCRTFQGAHDKTAPGGSIKVSDAADYLPVAINKAITIDGGGVATIGVPSGIGITVSAGTSEVVIIRNLSINGLGGGGTGIQLNRGQLRVENASISDFAGGGGKGMLVSTSAFAVLTVENTTITDCNAAGISISSSVIVATELDHVRIWSSGTGLAASNGARITLRNSEVSLNAGSGVALSQSGQGSEVDLVSTTLNYNNKGVQAIGANTVARITHNMIMNNGTGLSPESGGQIISAGDNTLVGNFTNGEPTSSLTKR